MFRKRCAQLMNLQLHFFGDIFGQAELAAILFKFGLAGGFLCELVEYDVEVACLKVWLLEDLMKELFRNGETLRVGCVY